MHTKSLHWINLWCWKQLMSLCAAQSPPLQEEHPPHIGWVRLSQKSHPGFQTPLRFSHQIEQDTGLVDSLEELFFFFFLLVYFPWGMCKKLEIFYCNIEYIIHIIRCDAPLAGFLHPLGFFQRREDFCWVSNTCTAYISFFISVL